jgi:phage baseplate assembly protein gpV
MFAAARGSADRELLIQKGESDFDLLADLAAASGLYPYLDGGTLRLIGLEGEGDELELSLGRALLSARLVRSRERSIARAEARSWLTTTLAGFKATAGLASQDAFEFRDVGLGTGAGPAPEHILLNALADNEDATRALAQTIMDRAAAAEAFVEGVALGDPGLRPGRPVNLTGVAANVTGRYVITEALHRFDAASGYRTEFATTPPARSARAGTPVFAIGEVSVTADPENHGRCRVKLPALGDVESGWLQVLVPGAGAGKGMVALPEAGDHVLVVFPDGDAARGIVLGGLYGQKALPRGVRGRRNRPFVLRTAAGQALELSSDSAQAKLSNSRGNLLELTGSGARLAAAGDLVIEAPGKTITIRADAVNFERG